MVLEKMSNNEWGSSKSETDFGDDTLGILISEYVCFQVTSIIFIPVI